MIRRRLVIAIAVTALVAAAAVVAYRFAAPRPSGPPSAPLASPSNANEAFSKPNPATAVPELTPLFPEPEAPPAPPRPEPYDPPETPVDFESGNIGRQRVPAAAAIGDIGKIVYHAPSDALLMAVWEPDNTRAVWKLSSDGSAKQVFALNTDPGEFVLHVTSDGILFAQSTNPERLFRSADGGETWSTVLEESGMFWNIADDGKGTMWGSEHAYNSAKLYRSVDGGLTWHLLKDFQEIFPQYAVTYAEGDDRFRLRHLHDVLFAGGNLYVGTGDVARFTFMSSDGGETWGAVWDEGATAMLPTEDGKEIILGPDQLHRHGVALYDVEGRTTKQVWNPIPWNYAGYVYSIVAANSAYPKVTYGGKAYYVGVHVETNEVPKVLPKYGILASPDGTTWYPFIEFGPLTHFARTDIWLAAGKDIVYASMNGALYAFKPLRWDWFGFRKPFQYYP